ncbi:hypothetical protein B0H66DRAFT_377749 [Apodospora peruviana]|uniref:Only prolin and serin are matching in the corresponding protein n=1 Tax=Apodospora peruviana TaxID=516989 RepID=A0AAE0HTI0_9PEZI|nr:hypothetical protein B0H66DRAFT_377749 [Apodospora peruviana]
MSPKLKPLLLPQMVEDRRKLELQQQQLQHHQQLHVTDPDHTYLYSSQSSSSSDLVSPSPVTPTFSRSHSRYSESASSLEMITSNGSDSPSSPTLVTHANKGNKSHLPDVQEDPLERDEDNIMVPGPIDGQLGLYDCLCDEPCVHHSSVAQSPATYPCIFSDVDFDFILDSDLNGSSEQKRRRHASDVSFSNWGTRLGSKLSSLPRWGSTSRRHHFAFSPASDTSLDQRTSFSRAASSRSSSISVPARMVPDRTNEPPLPPTPALSFYDSTESVVLPFPADPIQITAGKSLERERAMATTPLLPPLFIDTLPPQTQPSPLQSPTVAPSEPPEPTVPIHQTYPTPPLSTKASVASFRRATISGSGELPSPIPFILDQHHDAWSDRLGHANFTIEPKPYSPETADLATLQSFHADWDLARVNYTKHLVRTGEHYGTTSKTYALTEAKWAETEQEWRVAEEDLMQRYSPQGNTYIMTRRATDEIAAIPRMLSDEGKFPHRGDVDIVGPMIRDEFMIRDVHEEKKNIASVWLKSFAEKVRLRR